MISDVVLVSIIMFAAMVLWCANWYWGWRFTRTHLGNELTNQFNRRAKTLLGANIIVFAALVVIWLAMGLILPLVVPMAYAAFALLLAWAAILNVAASTGVWPLWFVTTTRLIVGEAKAVHRMRKTLRDHGNLSAAG